MWYPPSCEDEAKKEEKRVWGVSADDDISVDSSGEHTDTLFPRSEDEDEVCDHYTFGSPLLRGDEGDGGLWQ